VRSDLHRAAFQPSYRRSELEGVYALSRRSQLLAGRIFRHDPHDQADNAVHEYIHAAAHFVIKEVHDRDISAPEVRPKSEILNDTEEAADSVEDESFSQEEIVQTTRLARDHAFGHFDSGRASNASYEDTQFFELQTFMGMVRCGATQELLAFSTGVAGLRPTWRYPPSHCQAVRS